MTELGTSHSEEVRVENIDISVVMACYTEERLANIDAALASLQRQKLRPRAVIVAVDNNDSLADLLRNRVDWVTVVVNRCHRGASSTRNCGVQAVATEYTAILDDDETADPDWLLELTRPLTEPDVVGTGGKYIATWAAGKPSWFPDEFGWVVGHSYQGQPTVTAPVRNVWSGNMAMRTETFRNVGGFRTDFGKGASFKNATVEDTDLCIRMAAAAGGRWMYVPTAIVDHVVPRSRTSLGYFVSRCFAEGRGKALMSMNLESASIIDTERDYARSTVRAAVGRLSSLSWAANSQGLVMVLGLASAVSGYLISHIGNFSSHAKERWVRMTAGSRRAAAQPVALETSDGI
jgi:GT2 family glycosyltransferase